MKRLMAFILVLGLVIGHCSVMPLVYEVSAQSEAAALMITQQPSNQTVKENEDAVFHVQASGEGLTYQWYVKTSPTGDWSKTTMSGTGFDTDTLTIKATRQRNGFSYKCAVTDSTGNTAESDSAVLTISDLPASTLVITRQPTDQIVEAGNNAIFRMAAEGKGLTYQWYVKTSPTGGWTMTRMSGTGYNTNTLTIAATTGRNGFQYKCMVKDSDGYVLETSAATLTIGTPPPPAVLAITEQPTDQTVNEGEDAIFTVSATGDNLAYQWYVKTSEYGDWSKTVMSGTGFDTERLKINAIKSRNGFRYKCIITDGSGSVVETNEAVLIIADLEPDVLKILSQPASQAVVEGETAVFSLVAEGVGLTYQWYVRMPASDGWTMTRMAGTGYDTDTLSIAATSGRNGFKYKCIVKDAEGNTKESLPVELTLKAPEQSTSISITQQPSAQTVNSGDNAVFSVTAQGEKLMYQWYVRTSDTADWCKTSMPGTGFDTDTLTIQGTKARNGFIYKCVITDSTGKALETESASLTVINPVIRISTQPADQTVTEGALAIFTFKATGDGLSYQWYVKTSAAADWTATRMPETGYDTNTLKITATTGRNGFGYKCLIKDKYGHTAETEVVTLSIGAAESSTAIQVVSQPSDQNVKEGDDAVFTFNATGRITQYQWYVKTSSTASWSPTRMPGTGFDTNTLTIQGIKSRNGFQYKCILTDDSGGITETNTVTLVVTVPALTLTVQPENQVVGQNNFAVFHVKAEGKALSYQWYVKTSATANWTATRMPGTGYDTDTLSIQATQNRNGFQYKCAITDANGTTLETDIVSLNIVAKPVITQQPADVTGYTGEAAVITVKASGETLSYDWQTSPDGKNWSSVGETSTEYHLTITNEAGFYRCVITDSYGQQVISGTAQVIAKADDYALPTNLSFTQNGTVSFHVVEPQAHTVMLGLYRQELMTSVSARMEGETVDPVASTLVTVIPIRLKAGTESYSINVSNLFDISAEYYVAAKAVESASAENARDLGIGHTITSNTVYFLRPEQSLEAPAGIRWSEESYGRAEWNAVEGAASYQVMLYAHDDIVASRNINTTFFDFSTGWVDVRKITENGYTFTVTAMSSDITTLSNSAESVHSTVLGEPESTEPVSIVTQPASKYASLNSKLTTNLKAEGIGLTYDWYVDGVLAAEELDNASFNMDASREGSIRVYAVVHDAFGNTVTSDTAVITVVDDRAREHVITEQPADVTIDAGQTAYFEVKVEAIPHFDVEYHWYVSVDNGESWEDWFDTDRWTSVSGNVDRSGTKYRCEVRVTAPTGVVVCTEMSSAAVLTVNPLPIVIDYDLENRYFTETTQSVTVWATGENLSYTWYYKTNDMADFAVYENVSGNRLVIEDIQVQTVIYCVIHNDEASVQSNRATVYPGNNPASDISIYQYSGPNASHLAVGDSVGLAYSLTPYDSDSKVTWRSDDESVVSVSDGTVTAKAFGTANITATANGHTATFTVTVDSYRIEYNPEGGVFVDGSTSNRLERTVRGAALTLPVVSKADDTFLGWTTDGETVITEMTASADTTLFARWEESTQQEDKALAIEQDLQPNQYARIGTNALFEVVTNGAKVRSYCWMVNDGSGWMPIYNGITNDGAKTSLEVAASEDNNGYSYKVVITAFRDDAVVESAVATLTTGETDTPPQTETKFHFTAQPQNTAVTEGENATFTVAVDAETASYQWQCRSGSDWVDVEGATGTELILTETTLAMNAKEYRCQVTVNEKTQSSAVAVLTVNQKPVIHANSVTVEKESGEESLIVGDTLVLKATTEPKDVTDSVLWETSDASVATVSEGIVTITGLGNATIYAVVGEQRSSYSITVDHVQVTYDPNGGYLEETVVRADLGEFTPAVVPTQDGVTFVGWSLNGSDVQTSVSLTGNVTLIAVWEQPSVSCNVTYDANGGHFEDNTFTKTVEVPSGAYTPEFTPEYSNHTFLGWSLNGELVSDSIDVTENITLLAEWEENSPIEDNPNALVFIEQPQDIYEVADQTATFSVSMGFECPDGVQAASDEDKAAMTYRWQTYTDNAWVDIEGASGSSCDVTISADLDGSQYRVIVGFGNQETASPAAVLHVVEKKMKVTSRFDESICVAEYDYVDFWVYTNLSNETFEWHEIAPDGTDTILSGEKSWDYRFRPTVDLDGYRYYCVVTCGGQTARSKTATISVEALTVTSSFDESICVRAYEEVNLSVATNSDYARFQWHKLAPDGTDTILIGETSSYYLFRPAVDLDGYRYYCVVTNGEKSIQSEMATISVEPLSEAPSSVTISADRTDFDLMMPDYVTLTSQIRGLSSTEDLVYWWQCHEDNDDKWFQINDSWCEDSVNEIRYEFMPHMNGNVYFRLNVNGVASNIVKVHVFTSIPEEPYDPGCPCGSDCGCGMGSECTCGMDGMDGTMMMSANRMTMSLPSAIISEQNTVIQSTEIDSTEAVNTTKEDDSIEAVDATEEDDLTEDLTEASTEAVDTTKEDDSIEAVDATKEDDSIEAVDVTEEDDLAEAVDTNKEDASTEAVETTKEDASTAETTAVHIESDTPSGTVISDSDMK